MLVHLKSKQEFESLIKNGVVLVDFFATWCGPCKMLTPELEKLADKDPSVTVVKVDVDELSELAAEFGITSVPTMILFKNGENIFRTSGYRPLNGLEEIVAKAK